MSYTNNDDIIFGTTFDFAALIRLTDLAQTVSGISHNNDVSITIMTIMGKLMKKSNKFTVAYSIKNNRISPNSF